MKYKKYSCIAILALACSNHALFAENQTDPAGQKAGPAFEERLSYIKSQNAIDVGWDSIVKAARTLSDDYSGRPESSDVYLFLADRYEDTIPEQNVSPSSALAIENYRKALENAVPGSTQWRTALQKLLSRLTDDAEIERVVRTAESIAQSDDETRLIIARHKVDAAIKNSDLQKAELLFAEFRTARLEACASQPNRNWCLEFQRSEALIANTFLYLVANKRGTKSARKELVEKYYEKYSSSDSDLFVARNNALTLIDRSPPDTLKLATAPARDMRRDMRFVLIVLNVLVISALLLFIALRKMRKRKA
jgi:hypothetical protein